MLPLHRCTEHHDAPFSITPQEGSLLAVPDFTEKGGVPAQRNIVQVCKISPRMCMQFSMALFPVKQEVLVKTKDHPYKD
jgi:hypothetical protein